MAPVASFRGIISIRAFGIRAADYVVSFDVGSIVHRGIWIDVWNIYV